MTVDFKPELGMQPVSLDYYVQEKNSSRRIVIQIPESSDSTGRGRKAKSVLKAAANPPADFYIVVSSDGSADITTVSAK